MVSVVVVIGLTHGSDEPGDTAPPAPSTTSAPTTSTSTVVERTTLPPGTHELATALEGRDAVAVRAAPPRGWDRTLTPVVSAEGPEPPRTGADLQRVALPNPDQAIVGRAVTETGWVFSNPTAYQPPQPLVFGVVERQGDWVEVQLPVRPNGTTGWVSTDQVRVSATTMTVVVSLGERRLRVVDSGDPVFDVPAGIGRPTTPTPTGTFTVTDIVPSTDPAGSYGPVALALDGYSEVMDRFGSENAGSSPDANVPVLAIHGTNRPASVGAASSNGCVHLANDDMVALAQLVPAGTPVQIWP